MRITLALRSRLLAELLGERLKAKFGDAELVTDFRRIEPGQSDVVLIDLALRGSLEWLRAHSTDKVVVFANRVCAQKLTEAYQLNCRGYVSDQDAFATLEKIIVTVANGGVCHSPVMREVFSGLRRNALEKILTRRELQVLRCFADGLDVREMAARLEVRPSTVIEHRKNLARKLRVNCQTQLLRLCYERGLIEQTLLP